MKKNDQRRKQHRRVVFLDRDGVINQDSDAYIKSRDEFRLISGSLEAMVRLHRAGFAVVVITNQSAVGRGMIPAVELEAIHAGLTDTVRSAGGMISGIFYCPHSPDAGCDCRKPKPGLIRTAAVALDIDIQRTVMVGDSMRDLESAKNAGCGRRILVLTGNGNTTAAALNHHEIIVDYIAEDLSGAADWIIRTIT